MPIIQNGRPAVALRYVDDAGVEHQVVQVRLGDRLVWDGTTPALMTMPRAVGTGVVRAALTAAGRTMPMPLADHSAGEARPAVISAGANLVMPCATGTGVALEPDLYAGVEAAMPTALGDGQAYPAAAGEASPGDFNMPRANGAGVVYPAVVSIPFERAMPHIAGVGEAYAATVHGEATPETVAAVGSGVTHPAAAQFGRSNVMPRALGTGSAAPAVASAAVNATMPSAVGTGQANPAVIQTFVPMGAYMTELYDGWSNGSWNNVNPLLALPAYSGTVLADSGGIKYGVVSSAGTATVYAQATYGTTRSGGQQVRIKKGGTVVATGTLVDTAVATATWTGVVAAGDIITMEFYGDSRGAVSRYINPGQTATYLTVNPA